jgi:putative membrane protein
MSIRSLILLPLALAALPAAAQFGNPAGVLPGTPEARPGVPAPGHANVQDRLFVKLVGMGNAGEVQLARFAETRAANREVKAFATQMVRDHTAMGDKLGAVARALNLTLPNDIDPDQKAARARLETLQGTAFDAAYLQAQLVDHQKTVTLLQWEIASGQDASLQALAKESLPTVMEHLRHVQHLLGEVTAAGPQGLAAADAPAKR